MAVCLPQKICDELDSLCLPDGNGASDGQLVRIQQLQIAHHLEHRNESWRFVIDTWWPSFEEMLERPRGSVALVYAMFVARQFLVRIAYHRDRETAMYDPTTIVSARALGTRFDLAVAKHIFEFFYAEGPRRWRDHVTEIGTPKDLEHETQFVYGLWKGLVPKEHPRGHAHIARLMEQLTCEANRRFSYPQAPFPHDAVELTPRSAGAHTAGLTSQATLRPTVPSSLGGGAA